MPGHKAYDAFLHLFKVPQGLRHPQHHARMPHRVHSHCSGGYNKAAPGRDSQRDADGMPAAKHQRRARFADAGDQFGQRKAGLHIAADCVEDDKQAFNGGVLLNIHKLRNHMFILGGFLGIRRKRMPFDRTDDGQAMDRMAAACGIQNAFLLNQFVFQSLFGGVCFVRAAVL